MDQIENTQELKAYKKLRANWENDIVRYSIDRFGINPTWQQRGIYEAVCPEGSHTSCRSGHGIGKSTALATVGLWFLETRPFCRVPCTAPSFHQLHDVLWGEIAKLIRKSDDLFEKKGINPLFWLGNLLKVTRDKVYVIGSEKDWFMSARTSRKENPDALQGAHATEVTVSEDGKSLILSKEDFEAKGKILFLLEEASGIPDEIYQVAEGALSSHGARMVMVGNPTSNNGFFADSHKKHRSQYTCLHYSSADSPLADPTYEAKLIRKYGKNSNVVRVRCYGKFPTQAKDVLISFDDCEAAITRPKTNSGGIISMGLDPARYGDDRTCFLIRRGRDILFILTTEKESAAETVGRAKQLIEQFGVEKTYVDTLGMGGPIADFLIDDGYEVVEVVASNTAPERDDSDDIQCALMRDYLWVECKKYIMEDEPSFFDVDEENAKDLAAEISDIKFGFRSRDGFLKVESKDDMKKRLKRSPDIGDALCLTFAPDENAWEIASAGANISKRLGGY